MGLPSISSSSLSLNNFGVADGATGNIAIRGQTGPVPGPITLTKTQFTTEAKGDGAGGTITLSTTGILQSSSSRVSTSANEGDGGSIMMTAGESVFLDNNSLIAANSSGSGDAGNIFITAGRTVQIKDSSVTTQAANASGGSINLQATDLVYLLNSQVSASANGVTPGNDGGNVSIDPTFVVLIKSAITATANAGNGGNITINTGFFLKDSVSVLDASSSTGINGEVVINSAFQTLTAEINVLDASFLDVKGLLSKTCAASAASARSTFVVANRGSVPRSPDSYFPSAVEDIQPRVQLSQYDPQDGEKLLQLAQIQPISVDWAKRFGCA
ncbi:MAG: hypothetical protein E4H01_16960 [Lysobacterales bacterium]|nr:MAG: hypothetical protein E4H01_16960 [Xanthomonadales bacterium]